MNQLMSQMDINNLPGDFGPGLKYSDNALVQGAIQRW